jgi:lactoylglutathione lyase
MQKLTLNSLALILITQLSMAQPPKARLNHIALYVTDLKLSTAFYQQIIGLDTIPEPFHDGKHTWFSIGDNSHLHLIQGATTPANHPKNTHLCFSVASVDLFTETLNKHKVNWENWAGEKSIVTKRVDGVKQVYFKDPDGYWIEVNDARE